MKKLLFSLLTVLCSVSSWAATVTPVYKDFTGLGTNVVYVQNHANITTANTTAIMASAAASSLWLTAYNNEAWTGDNISERTLGINPDTDESMSGKLMGGRMKNSTDVQRCYWFYVTGVNAVWIYHEANSSRKAHLDVYEKDVETAVFTANTSDKTIKATGLDTSKKYIVKVYGDGADVYFYAAKFFGTASTKDPSTFALTSESELILTPNSTSQITTTGNAGTVTYSSDATEIATVSNSGLVTAVAGGIANIVVSDPGTSTVDGRELSVIVKTLYAEDTESDIFKFDNAGYFLTNDGKWYFKNGWSISTNQGYSYASLPCNGKTNNGFKVSANKTYTINVPAGVTVRYARVIMRSNYGSDKAAANWGTIFGQDLTSETLPYSSEDAVVKEFAITDDTPMTFTPGGNQCQMYIELYTGVPVTVNAIGNASFSCDKALDFTQASGVKAYMVTDETATSVTLTQINKVPANTGIFVIGEAGTHNIPVLAGTADATTNNKLVATTTAYNVTGSDNIWALSKDDGMLHPVTSGTIAAGKAYLVSTVIGGDSGARTLIIEDETTGIQSVKNYATNGQAYNLAGQRVAANAKGMVIINGKKYLNK